MGHAPQYYTAKPFTVNFVLKFFFHL
jgi:hypothetical protein